MAKIRALLGKVRIEFIAIGLFILTLVVFSARLYVCRIDGTIVQQNFYLSYPLGVAGLVRALVLDALFATIGFMAFENKLSRRTGLVFKAGFGLAALLFVLDFILVLANGTNDPTVFATFFVGRAELGGDSVIVGGFAFGFYLHALLLVAYGVAAFLHPGYTGTDEPTLWAWLIRKLNRRDPLRMLPRGNDPVLAMDIPYAIFLCVVTFGVYYYVWMYHTIKAMKKVMNDASPVRKDFLLSLLVLPGIHILFALRMKKYEEHLFANRERFGLKKSDMSIPYLILTILGFLGIVSLAMMQLDLNRLAPAAAADTVAQPAA